MVPIPTLLYLTAIARFKKRELVGYSWTGFGWFGFGFEFEFLSARLCLVHVLVCSAEFNPCSNMLSQIGL